MGAHSNAIIAECGHVCHITLHGLGRSQVQSVYLGELGVHGHPWGLGQIRPLLRPRLKNGIVHT